MEGPVSIDLSSLRTGPFISGTSHTILRLGQPPVQAFVSRTKHSDPSEKRPSKKAKTETGKKGKSATTLKDIIDAGLISPGRNKLTVVYKGITYLATLQEDGTILYQGDQFMSASSFSMHVKHFQTPGRQGDDGWKSVTYEGNPLDHYRKQFASISAASKATQKNGEGNESEAQDVADTDHWVQCDRCRTWRVVPDENWPAVEADEREDWLCDYATWDVSQFAPFKEACNNGVNTDQHVG